MTARYTDEDPSTSYPFPTTTGSPVEHLAYMALISAARSWGKAAALIRSGWIPVEVLDGDTAVQRWDATRKEWR